MALSLTVVAAVPASAAHPKGRFKCSGIVSDAAFSTDCPDDVDVPTDGIEELDDVPPDLDDLTPICIWVSPESVPPVIVDLGCNA